MEERTRGGIRAFEGVEALVGASLLLALNLYTGLWLASLSCFPVGLAERLMQGLRQPQDSGAITMRI